MSSETLSPAAAPPHPLLRRRDGHHARVTFEELFFDLVYVFAVTQVSHLLHHHMTGVGVVEALILWFAVWLGWQYTCWVTNWFDPETPPIRGVLFVTMLIGLVMAAALPEAFGARGLVFAAAYVAMQVGRTLFVVLALGRDHPLAANYRRMLGWLTIAAVFWIAGAFVEHEARMALWLVAVACEYVSPMIGFALLGLGRSTTRDWTIEGGHLAERCQLFVIVALGETLLATGATLAEADHWPASVLAALIVTFLGTLAMWWLYFGTSSRDATAAIVSSDDPGRIGARFHYAHAVLVAGIIVMAVGNDIVMAHATGHPSPAEALVLLGGPAIYLLGSTLYKRVVYGVWPGVHLIGVAVLMAVVPVAGHLPMTVVGLVAVIVLAAVGAWELGLRRRRQVA